MMSPVEPTDPPPEPDPSPSHNRFEDFEIPTPMATPRGRARRPAVVTTAAIVLLVAGLLNLLAVVLFRPSGTATVLFLLLGVAQFAGAILIVLLLPIGRTLGFVLGAVGIVLGVVRASDNATSALMSIALNGFVIYALVTGGPAFNRE
jgi:hypothetical protein